MVSDYTHKIVVKEDGTQSLIIAPAMPQDSGEWTVIAQNRAGRSSTSITLTVDGKTAARLGEDERFIFFMCCFLAVSAKETLVRPQFTEKLKNISIKQGTLVELAVRAIGNPLPDIVWLKNSDIITPHKHPHIRYVSGVISIIHVHFSDGQKHMQVVAVCNILLSSENIKTDPMKIKLNDHHKVLTSNLLGMSHLYPVVSGTGDVRYQVSSIQWNPIV